MKIHSITTCTNNKQPAFLSMRNKTLDKCGNIINCNYTNLNRKDIAWAKLAKFLEERFQGFDKVPINLYGCSDGSDAYTLALTLLYVLKEKSLKFFPIIASDISKEMIDLAQKGQIYLHKEDLSFLKSLDSLKYFERNYSFPSTKSGGIEFFLHDVKQSLRDCINFSQKDVLEDVKKKSFVNEVFLFRNGWGFNTLKAQDEIAKSLYQASNSKTLVVIGQSDLYKSGASDFLQINGFKGIESDIFTKAETNYPGTYIGQPKTSLRQPFILFEK